MKIRIYYKNPLEIKIYTQEVFVQFKNKHYVKKTPFVNHLALLYFVEICHVDFCSLFICHLHNIFVIFDMVNKGVEPPCQM